MLLGYQIWHGDGHKVVTFDVTFLAFLLFPLTSKRFIIIYQLPHDHDGSTDQIDSIKLVAPVVRFWIDSQQQVLQIVKAGVNLIASLLLAMSFPFRTSHLRKFTGRWKVII